MKNKFVKFINLGICCIMFSVLISAYIPQTGTIQSNLTDKNSIFLFVEDPPFH